MLRYRLPIGTLLVALLVLAGAGEHYWLPPGAVLVPVAVLLSLAAAAETRQLLQPHGAAPWRPLALVPAALLVASPGVGWYLVPDWELPGLAAGVLVVLVVGLLVSAVWEYEPEQKNTLRLAGAAFVLLYAGGTLCCLVLLRYTGPEGKPTWGVPLILTTVLVVKSGDIGAYTLGRLLGRRKLVPRLSPGKTWAGAFGAVLLALAVSWACFRFLLPQDCPLRSCPLAPWAFGLVIAVTGILGDLVESLLKRDAGVKDSGSWIPGFGGVLDLLDSIQLASPVALLFFRLAL